MISPTIMGLLTTIRSDYKKLQCSRFNRFIFEVYFSKSFIDQKYFIHHLR
jgi:hypothetical protein